jgi:sugar lactone lactonase YvrE
VEPGNAVAALTSGLTTSMRRAWSIPNVVAAGARAELVRDGFQFTQGPVGTPDGGLSFTDLGANVLYRLDPVTTVAPRAGANPALLKPNDLIVDRRGGVYVTDPGRDGRRGRAFVHYIRPDRRVLRVSGEISRPNGLTLTRTEAASDVDPEEFEARTFAPRGASSRMHPRFLSLVLPESVSLVDGFNHRVDVAVAKLVANWQRQVVGQQLPRAGNAIPLRFDAID